MPTRSGPPTWTATTVRRLLENETQTGMVRVSFDGKDAWVPGGHESIVERERWEAARAVPEELATADGGLLRRRRAGTPEVKFRP